MKTRISTLTAFLLLCIVVSAQDGYKEIKDSLQSSILKQKRMISVFLPEGYKESKAKFPVIYVLDADGRDQHIVPTARFLFLNNKMPKAIVVGVFNIDRNHDFLPLSSDKVPFGGGADNFMNFFKTELIPYIDKTYKANNFKVLVGHSYGGEFAMHVLLNDPDIFDAYIAIDPSFWYDKKAMVKTAMKEFSKSKNWSKAIFISGREGRGMDEMGINSMDTLLQTAAPKELDWKIVSYPNEDHGSVTFKTAYDGLRYIFDAGSDFAVYPQTAMIPKGSFTYALLQNLSPNVRYTLDGKEPDMNSPVCKDTIRINGPCVLKVKAVSKKYGNFPTVTRVFEEGNFMNGEKSIKGLKQGLKYSYYEGVWDSLPDYSKLKAIKTGITDSLDLHMALKKDSFGIRFEGYLYIKEKGMYNIFIVSDDGSKLYFNNKLLLNNDGLHSANNPVVSLLPLNPGYYPLRVDFFERTGEESIMIGTVVGLQQPRPAGKAMFFYK
jgi:predicted alpha/beta superfamily hydrolase